MTLTILGSNDARSTVFSLLMSERGGRERGRGEGGEKRERGKEEREREKREEEGEKERRRIDSYFLYVR